MNKIKNYAPIFIKQQNIAQFCHAFRQIVILDGQIVAIRSSNGRGAILARSLQIVLAVRRGESGGGRKKQNV